MAFKCGRGLAADGGVSGADACTDSASSGASPLPLWVGVWLRGRALHGSQSSHAASAGKYIPPDAWRSNVGGGLLPMAVCQAQTHALTVPHRGQAPSHIGLVYGLELAHCPEANPVTPRLRVNTFLLTHGVQMWEGACPRWRCVRRRCIHWQCLIGGKPPPTLGWCMA